MNNKKSHIFTPCYINENKFSFHKLNFSFFKLKAKNAKGCYVNVS